MLRIEIPVSESFDESTSSFVNNCVTVEMEHSLVSLSKWESRFEKPFLSQTEKTVEETLWYVEAMTITPNVPPEVFYKLSDKNISEINAYINGKQTATTIKKMNRPASRQIITAEIIYSWMIALNIPKEFETWHLNRLFIQIEVINEQKGPQKKMSRNDMIAQRRSLNEQRKAAMGTSG